MILFLKGFHTKISEWIVFRFSPKVKKISPHKQINIFGCLGLGTKSAFQSSKPRLICKSIQVDLLKMSLIYSTKVEIFSIDYYLCVQKYSTGRTKASSPDLIV